jgi:hypothetical protein
MERQLFLTVSIVETVRKGNDIGFSNDFFIKNR